MTNYILPFSSGRIPLKPFGTWIADLNITRERPAFANFLRIYETTIDLADDEATSVLADAIQMGIQVADMSSADAIIKEYGVVGVWRPSTIIVDRFTDYGANRLLVEHTVAHALWTTDLHTPHQRGWQFRLELTNDEDRIRYVRPYLHCTEMTDADLAGDPQAGLLLRVESLEREIAKLKQSRGRGSDLGDAFDDDEIDEMVDRANRPPKGSGW